MSKTTYVAAMAARDKIRLEESEGRGVEELEDEIDPGPEERLQERLVGVGQTSGRRPSLTFDVP